MALKGLNVSQCIVSSRAQTTHSWFSEFRWEVSTCLLGWVSSPIPAASSATGGRQSICPRGWVGQWLACCRTPSCFGDPSPGWRILDRNSLRGGCGKALPTTPRRLLPAVGQHASAGTTALPTPQSLEAPPLPPLWPFFKLPSPRAFVLAAPFSWNTPSLVALSTFL